MTPARRYLHRHLADADLPGFVKARGTEAARQALDFASNVPTDGRPESRYPETDEKALDAALRTLFTADERRYLDIEHLVIVRGVSEGIDLITRAAAGRGRPVVSFGPTFPMYRYWAAWNAARYVELPNLKPGKRLPQQLGPKSAALHWLCHPNNPTGRACESATLRALAERVPGLLAVDETYLDFSDAPSAVALLRRYPNVVVARSLSKAWGLAGERLGLLVAHPSIAKVLRAIQGPYAVSAHAFETLRSLPERSVHRQVWIRHIRAERARVQKSLEATLGPERLVPSDANFFFVSTRKATIVEKALAKKGLLVGAVDGVGIRFCLRSAEENDRLLRALIPLLED